MKNSPGRVLPRDLVIPLEPKMQLIVNLALCTGLRLSEILRLRIEQIMVNGKIKSTVRVRRKGGVDQDIGLPIPEEIKAFLDYRTEGWLFIGKSPRKFGDFARLDRYTASKDWHKAQVQAGISPTYRFHDLRHTAITRFAEIVKDPFLTQAFAGHARIETTMIYHHVNKEAVWKAQEEMMKGEKR